MRTNQNYTNEILSGYLMDNNHVNIEYLADEIIATAEIDERLYDERLNTRRKTRNIAINEMMHFINIHLAWSGYRGYYASNAQVMRFDRDHGGDLEKVLDIVEQNIIDDREDRAN